MKMLALYSLLFATVITAASATGSDIPELKLWYELKNPPYGSSMSYLPSFDTAVTRSAIAILRNPGVKTATWYNTKQYDSVDQFSWSADANGLVIPIDLNNDGITDYYDGSGSIFQGVANGQLPSRTVVKKSSPFVFHPFFGDFNNDHYSDMIFPITNVVLTSSTAKFLGILVLGANPLDSIKSYNLPLLPEKYQQLVGAYVAKDGSPRVIALIYDDLDRLGSLVLYKLHINSIGSKIEVTYDVLSMYSRHFASHNDMNGFTGFFHTTDLNESTLIWKNQVFSVDNDSLSLVRLTNWNSNPSSIVSNNCASADILFITYLTDIDTNGIQTGWRAIVKGNPRIEHKPLAKVPNSWKVENNGEVLEQAECAAGDVNGDGIMDYLFYYSGADDNNNISRLRFYLGIDATLSVPQEQDFPTLFHVSPLCLSAKETIHLQYEAALKGSCRVSLFDMRGANLATLYTGDWPADGALDLDLSAHQLASGVYTIRFECGAVVVGKSVLVY